MTKRSRASDSSLNPQVRKDTVPTTVLAAAAEIEIETEIEGPPAGTVGEGNKASIAVHPRRRLARPPGVPGRHLHPLRQEALRRIRKASD